jgi:hypothetical protein
MVTQDLHVPHHHQVVIHRLGTACQADAGVALRTSQRCWKETG